MEPDKNLIHYSEVQPYYKTVYDCFKNGAINEQFNWIETQNKNMFEYSNKKMALIRFRGYLEKGRPDAIDAQLRKTPLKKIGLSPIYLAEIYFDYKLYEKAILWRKIRPNISIIE